MRLTEQIAGLNTSSNTIMVFGIYIGFRFTLVKTIFYLLFFIFFSGREFSKVQMPGFGGGGGGGGKGEKLIVITPPSLLSFF